MSGSNVYWNPAWQVRTGEPGLAALLGWPAQDVCASCGLGDHMTPPWGLCTYCDELHMRRARAHTRGRVALYYALACAVWLMVTANIAIGALILAGVIR